MLAGNKSNYAGLEMTIVEDGNGGFSMSGELPPLPLAVDLHLKSIGWNLQDFLFYFNSSMVLPQLLFYTWIGMELLYRSNSQFATFYYKMSFAFHFVPNAIYVVPSFVYYHMWNEKLAYVETVLRYERIGILSIVELVLMLNRLTAMIFWKQYKHIWRRRNTAIVCAFVLVYPWLSQIPYMYRFKCIVFGVWNCFTMQESRSALFLANTVVAACSVVLGMLVLYLRRHYLRHSVHVPGAEVRLFYVCVLSSVLNLLSTFYDYWSNHNFSMVSNTYETYTNYVIVQCVGTVIGALQTTSFMVVLPLLDVHARRQFAHFYGFGFCVTQRVSGTPPRTSSN